MKAALSGATVTSRWIARSTLPGPVIYAGSNAPDDFTWDNGSGPITYKGFDAAFGLTLAASDGQTKAGSTQITLSGTDPGVMASLFAEDYRGAPTDVCFLAFDPATGAPGDELVVARGVLDVGSLSDSAARPADPTQPQVSTLTLTVTDKAVDLDRAGARTATDVDQRLYRDALDGFFKDVALAASSQINWGVAGSGSPCSLAPAGKAATDVAAAIRNINIAKF
jgi:hypothetical protein